MQCYIFIHILLSGDGSISSTESYIAEVRLDQELQQEYDAVCDLTFSMFTLLKKLPFQFKARNSGLKLFLDIGLTLIALIPGVGDLGLLSEAIVKGINIVR